VDEAHCFAPGMVMAVVVVRMTGAEGYQPHRPRPDRASWGCCSPRLSAMWAPGSPRKQPWVM